MSWEELGLLLEGLSFASRPMRAATDEVTSRFSLGPRGAWILNLISDGHVYPLDIARIFNVGRPLVTAELTRLTAAGLVNSRQSEEDRRRTELALTDEGARMLVLIRSGLKDLAHHRLADFSRDELLLCSRILKAFRTE